MVFIMTNTLDKGVTGLNEGNKKITKKENVHNNIQFVITDCRKDNSKNSACLILLLPSNIIVEISK